MNSLRDDFKALLLSLLWYVQRKITLLANTFEGLKNFSVDVLMKRRGELQKSVWHGSIVGLASVGILTSGVLGGQTLVSSTYPGIGGPDPRFVTAFEPFPNGPLLAQAEEIHTDISDKPRAEIIDYTVAGGDTVSSIAAKYGVSQDTIKWANDLSDLDTIKPGQTIKILPVTGIAHTVKSGDSLESIAKKYHANSQAILDFPFNDIPDDFSLRAGQVLIVPDGVKEEAAPIQRAQPQYLAQGSTSSSPAFSAPSGGNFIWPTVGIITQYFSWYHPADDIANPAAPAIVASDGGVVIVAGWPDNTGYGNRVVLDHGNGYQTLYAHMSHIYVSVGQRVSRGQVLGQMGSTGRSTGTHLHFEIRYKGRQLNPLSILK